MLKIILIAIPAVIVVFLIVVAFQPSDFRIVRSTSIAASPEAVFPQVNDFHKWEAWSPWAKLDPAMKQTYDGATAGRGAGYYWVGNKKVGEGRMTIIESSPNQMIRIKLEFFKPFAAVNTTEFTFTPQGNQTAIIWSMTGTNNFMAKAFCLFMNMDRMVGGDFEKGLARMKSVAEASIRNQGR